MFLLEEVNEKDLLIMKLIHYFMMKKNYAPVIIRGIDNEIWLENPDGEFRIIRIVTKEIFNNEQFNFDDFKTKNIVSQIKRKTLNPFIDVLTIYLDIEDNFKDKINDSKFYKYINIKKEEDLDNNEIINKHFNDIKDHFSSFDNDSLTVSINASIVFSTVCLSVPVFFVISFTISALVICLLFSCYTLCFNFRTANIQIFCSLKKNISKKF